MALAAAGVNDEDRPRRRRFVPDDDGELREIDHPDEVHRAEFETERDRARRPSTIVKA